VSYLGGDPGVRRRPWSTCRVNHRPQARAGLLLSWARAGALRARIVVSLAHGSRVRSCNGMRLTVSDLGKHRTGGIRLATLDVASRQRAAEPLESAERARRRRRQRPHRVGRALRAGRAAACRKGLPARLSARATAGRARAAKRLSGNDRTGRAPRRDSGVVVEEAPVDAGVDRSAGLRRPTRRSAGSRPPSSGRCRMPMPSSTARPPFH